MTRLCDRTWFNVRTWIFSSAFVASGCQSQGVSSDMPAKQSSATTTKELKTTPTAKPVPRPDTGLAVGQKLPKLMGLHPTEDQITCLTCTSKDIPQLLVFGLADDPIFHELLQDVDAVMQKYDPQHIEALGIVARTSAKGLASQPSIEDWPKKLKTLQWKLRIKLKLATAITDTNGRDSLATKYGIRLSPALLLSNSADQVQFAAIAPPDLSQLDSALSKVLPEP